MMTNRIFSGVLLVAFLSAAGAVDAGTITVSAGGTIQVAIDSATTGDVILIEPGTYIENLSIIGKAITLEGIGGRDVTVIDGNASGSAIDVVDAPGVTELRGVTIQNGLSASGGGVNSNRSLTLDSCRVQACEADTGGGVFVAGAGSVLTLIDTDLVSNTSTSGGGAAVSTGASLTVVGGLISDNSAQSIGGGIRILSGVGVAMLSDCVFRNNTGEAFGGGLVWLGDLTLLGVSFIDNNSALGGGLVTDSILLMEDCRFSGNSAGSGGAMISDGVTTTRRSLFANNSSTINGAIVVTAINNVANLAFDRCTFVGNAGGGASLTPQGPTPLTMTNCIFRENGPINGDGTVTATFTNNDVGLAGLGNFDADPLFVDAASGDYELQAGSPCIDTGDPSSTLDPDGTIADVGAFPFDQSAVLLRRGDVNDDGVIHISDGIFILRALFLSGPSPACLDAADANDSGDITFTDAIYLFNYQLLGGQAPAAPFPDCGEDPTADGLECFSTMEVCL